MKTVSAVLLFVVVGLSQRAEAANLAVIASPPNLLSLLVLGLAVAAIAVGIQLLQIIRGGYLSRAWRIIVAGFGILALGQILALVRALEIATVPAWVVPALMVVWAGAFFYGVFEMKKVLS